MSDIYYHKYLKYKNKYLEAKERYQSGGMQNGGGLETAYVFFTLDTQMKDGLHNLATQIFQDTGIKPKDKDKLHITLLTIEAFPEFHTNLLKQLKDVLDNHKDRVIKLLINPDNNYKLLPTNDPKFLTLQYEDAFISDNHTDVHMIKQAMITKINELITSMYPNSEVSYDNGSDGKQKYKIIKKDNEVKVKLFIPEIDENHPDYKVYYVSLNDSNQNVNNLSDVKKKLIKATISTDNLSFYEIKFNNVNLSDLFKYQYQDRKIPIYQDEQGEKKKLEKSDKPVFKLHNLKINESPITSRSGVINLLNAIGLGKGGRLEQTSTNKLWQVYFSTQPPANILGLREDKKQHTSGIYSYTVERVK